MKKIFLLLMLIFIFVIIGCTNKADIILDKPGFAEMLIIPDEAFNYIKYIQAIGPKVNKHRGVIEGTVLSINKQEKCPFRAIDSEECDVEPYPLHTGKIRINKIINYINPELQGGPIVEDVEEAIEPGKPSEDSGERSTIAEPQPTHIGTRDIKELEEGQEVESIFFLTTDPSIVRYMTVYNEKPKFRGGPRPLSAESQPIQAQTDIATETSESPLDGGGNTEPEDYSLPKEDGHYVFTTEVFYEQVDGEVPEPKITTEKMMPGIKEGDKIRANMDYTGILYVGEYEIIS